MTTVDKRIIIKTKESIGRTFSILNLTSSAKINKKKTSGAKIITTKLTSRLKEESKFKTTELKIVSSERSKPSIDCNIFSKLWSKPEFEMTDGKSINKVVWEIGDSIKLELSDESCWYLSSRESISDFEFFFLSLTFSIWETLSSVACGWITNEWTKIECSDIKVEISKSSEK